MSTLVGFTSRTLLPLLALTAWACVPYYHIAGRVTDPQLASVPAASVTVLQDLKGRTWTQQTNPNGTFDILVPASGSYRLKVVAPGFEDLSRPITVTDPPAFVNVRLTALAAKRETVTVVGDVKSSGLLFPDPAQRVYIRDETLDANPGRPGAPISIPGLPVETASGGIKAPQYFAPGVAGDHGEPIAQYILVGSYLLPNNLSANAHGNGYADPNIMIPGTLEGVQIDGGAFNVREGNHAEDLAAVYELRSRLQPFLTLTGDVRDIDLVAGWSPQRLGVKSWVAVEAAYGNGFLDRLEHRQQYKLDGYREWDTRRNNITLYGIGYYGQSCVPGLVPIAVTGLHDTVDPRQKDQTHTGEIAVSDDLRLSPAQNLHLASSFRTYNLALYSNFGAGLIRQSEFRTVAGGEAAYTAALGEHFSFLVGLDYQRDAPQHLDLDHYLSNDPSVYGPYVPVSANNVRIDDAAPYIALDGSILKYLHFDLGWRRDEIQFENDDLLHAENSYRELAGFNSPKATLWFRPAQDSPAPWVAASFGEAFYTNDPRIGLGTAPGAPVTRAHSYQLVAGKTIAGVDYRVTLGHVTTEAALAKIDPDTGLQEDEGPARNRFITVAARREFRFGLLQASFSKADARDLDSGLPTPEAPRLIVDLLGTVNKLPFHLQARGEYEDVGRKPLGDGFVGVPVREFRGAILRTFRNGSLDVGTNFLIAKGYTGQTTEVIAANTESPPVEQVTGVRLASYATLSCTYRFRPRP